MSALRKPFLALLSLHVNGFGQKAKRLILLTASWTDLGMSSYYRRHPTAVKSRDYSGP